MKFFNLSKSIIAVCLLAGSVTQLCAAESATAVTNAAVSNSATNTAPAMRQLAESDLLELLTATLQKDYVKDLGELELRLTLPWTARSVPDEPLTIEVLDLPKQGVTPNFILRFELRTTEKSLGTFQISLQARVWREIWIARSALKRGELIADADLDRQRRDVLTLRESLAEFSAGDTTLEIAEPLQTGSALLARSVKVRPVIHRGQATDALIQDGALSITMKVEALEDGIPGQIIRARNPQTRRDLRGKVIDEQTILLAL